MFTKNLLLSKKLDNLMQNRNKLFLLWFKNIKDT